MAFFHNSFRIAIAIRINPNFEHYQETSEILTPYATEFRYPSDVMEPSPEELEDALIKAEELLDFVVSLLPDEIKTFLV